MIIKWRKAMAVYAVSDLHGHMNVFLEGLKKIEFSDRDELYVLGDAVDRGPAGIELLQYIKEHKNMDLLLGNHEFMMLESVDPDGIASCNGDSTELWLYYNGGDKTYKGYRKLSDAERKSLLLWMNGRMLIKTLEVGGKKYCLTHSFYIPQCENKIFSETDRDFVWAIVWASMFRNGDTRCKNVYKSYDYTFITGHVPVQRVRLDHTSEKDYNKLQSFSLGNFVDIDGGCAIGYNPEINNGALFIRLDDMKEFPVKMVPDS